jgi:hypothetical protein
MAGASFAPITLEFTLQEALAMSQEARITGKVEYRQGDGITATIRPGIVEVQTTPVDVTLSWSDGETRNAAAMPIADFKAYVEHGEIEMAT